MINLNGCITVKGKKGFYNIDRSITIKDIIDDMDLENVIFAFKKFYNVIKSNFDTHGDRIKINIELSYDFGNFSVKSVSRINDTEAFKNELYQYLISVTYIKETAIHIVNEVFCGE